MIKNSKNGVAVIVVMGILALLMVLAVSFSVTMRVERTGAANYTTAVNSRQLAWAALSRAITDINAVTYGFYPDGDFLVSRDAGVAWNSNGVGGVTLAIGRIRDYIPGVLRPVADSAVSEWIRLRPDEGMGGHVAYLVLNVSDLLDVNTVGGHPRGGGTNTAEVVLSGLAIDTNVLVEARHRLAGTGGFAAYESANLYPAFESLAELRALAPAVPANVFIDYSRFLPDQNRTNLVSIGGTTNELVANQAAINARLRTDVFYPSERPSPAAGRHLFDNLLDYIDEDSIPRDLNAPNGEAVPLLNEVVMLNNPAPRLRSDRFTGRFELESWFPFATPNGSGHSFAMRYHYAASVTLRGDTTNMFSVVSNRVSSAFTPTPMSFERVGATVSVPITQLPSNTVSVLINVAVSNLAVMLSSSATVVDSASNVVFNFTYDGPYVEGDTVLDPVSYQVSDPRLNWRTGDWMSYGSHTLGTTNQITLDYWQSNPALSRGAPLYVADRGFLYSPLELGNLLIPGPSRELAPWSTFRVLQQGVGALRHPLLEHFETTPVEVQRGLVNINSQDQAILAAAFRNMPHPYGEAGDPVLSNADASAAAAIITDARVGGTVFTNVTDILDLNWRAGHFAGRSDLDLEAMLAYASGLMGVQQNMFLILAAGSAGEEAMGVRGRQTVRTQARKVAMALVWRNPTPNAEGRYECFLKFFRWMDD